MNTRFTKQKNQTFITEVTDSLVRQCPGVQIRNYIKPRVTPVENSAGNLIICQYKSSSPGRGKNFPFTSSRPVLGPTQPLIQWVMGVPFSGVKQPRREADHSPPTTLEVKKS
jgi:hypothetical protein